MFSNKVFREVNSLYKDSKRFSRISTEFKKAISNQGKSDWYKSTENNPANHQPHHLSTFYNIPLDHFKRWFSKGLEPHFYKMCKSFQKNHLMVRKPAFEVIQFLKKVKMDQPLFKAVFYGMNGCGKSSQLLHTIHYAGVEDWIVIHLPWSSSILRYDVSDYEYSTFTKEMRVDQPSASTGFLQHFRQQNEPLLKKLTLKSTKNYVWNKREQTKEGDLLLDLINFGSSRPKYATDVVGVLLKEMRIQASRGNFKLLVAIDGLNAFWSTSKMKQEDNRRRLHPANELSLVQFFKRLLVSDWSNGAIVATVDSNSAYHPERLKVTPLSLLGQEGFEHLDPFLPLEVEDFDEGEFRSCLQYFYDNMWYIKSYSAMEEGIKEIKALSCMNPKELYYLGVWM